MTPDNIAPSAFLPQVDDQPQPFCFIDASNGSVLEANGFFNLNADTDAEGNASVEPGDVLRFKGPDGSLRHYRVAKVEEGMGRRVHLQPIKPAYGRLILLALLLVAAWFAIDAVLKLIF